MAIWQFDFYIIPKKYVNNYINEEDITSWRNENLDVIRVDFLQQTKCWSKDIIQYGDIDSTCIQYLYENKRLEEILCRLDLRVVSKSLINKFIEYINSINSIIYCNGNIIPPTYENILKEIRKSKAFSYCKNPNKYIEQLNDLKKE